MSWKVYRNEEIFLCKWQHIEICWDLWSEAIIFLTITSTRESTKLGISWFSLFYRCPFQSPQKDLSPHTYYCLQWSAFGSLYIIILRIQKSHYRWPVLCWQQKRSPGIPSRWSADDQLIDATSSCPASPSGSLLTWVTPGVKQYWQLWCTVCSDIRRTKMFLLHFTLIRSSF